MSGGAGIDPSEENVMTTVWAQTPRDFVMVEGADALKYLQSQLAQDLSTLAVGEARPSLLLEPQGKVSALVRVLRSGDHAYVIDVDAGFLEPMTARLTRFMIRVDAKVTAIPWRCIAVRGPEASTVSPTPGGVLVPAWWGDGTALDIVGPDPTPPVGIAQGTTEDIDAARVASGWPAMGAEITESSLPAEIGVVPVAVSFTKGCYPGQELVERMDSRGAQAPRTLRRFSVPAGTQVGDPVIVDGVEVARYTSVAGSHALALVKRSIAAGEPVGMGT